MNAFDAPNSGQLAGQTHLKLSGGLTEFPTEILQLADSLEFLNLSDNQLNTLPEAFGSLKQLRIVFFNNNNFTEFPEVLAACPQLTMASFKNNKISAIKNNALAPTLRWLTLTNNAIETLPPAIGKLPKLQKLMLAGNRLRSLPVELQRCQNLELIRLASNQLPELPAWLLALPRLSWLAYAGNPFCTAAASQRSLPTIRWQDLEVGPVLGQGASGVTYKGVWQSPEAPREVAIKLFKGEMTSDGSPWDEMRACIAAGSHPNLVAVLGKLAGHPQGQTGLVFEFLPADFVTLGNPPSLDSCTRDTYPAEVTFALPKLLQIAGGTAAAAAHLHANGILHGDLYAHNILTNAAGESILSDFGAASFYEPRDSPTGTVLELLEVRAYGCLLEELLARCSPSHQGEAAAIFDRLRRLQQACTNPLRERRPPFRAICETLAAAQEALP